MLDESERERAMSDMIRNNRVYSSRPAGSLRAGRIAALVIASTLAVALPALSGCEQKSAQADAASINLATAETRTFEIATLATGELAARDRVELRSDVERQTAIVEIVPEGSRVNAGDVLVRLNSDEIKREIEEEELQLSEARLNLESAQTAYEIQESDNKASLQKARLAVQLADLALQQWKNGDNIKALQQRNTAIEKTERDYNRLKDKYARSLKLHEQKFISDDELLRDEISLLEAEAAMETARLDMETYQKYQIERDLEQKKSDLTEAEQELVRVEKTNAINLKNRESTLQNRAVQVARREERLAEWTSQFEACTLRAPTDGLVVYGSTVQSDNWRSQNEGPIAVGRQIRNNDLIIALPDTSEMIASVKVHESLAGRVRPGQSANIKVEAMGDLNIAGEVESIGLLAETGGWRDPNRREYTVRVRVEPGSYSDDLKPSMRCQAELILGTVEQALTVPVQAVFSDGPVRYVLVPEGARFVRRPVNLGQRSDMYAQIAAGLEEGERVLIREPKAGEVVEGPWDEQQLADAGYSLDEEGNPIAPRRGRPGGRSRGGATTAKPVESESDKTAKTDIAGATPDAETPVATAEDGPEVAEAEDKDSAPTLEPALEPATEPATDPAG